MSLAALFVRAGDGVRTPWRLAFFAVATLCAGAVVSGIVYPVVAATRLVGAAREWNVPLDQLGLLVALLTGTWAALRVVETAPPGQWSDVGLGRQALTTPALTVGLAAGTLGILIPSALLLAAGRLRLEPQPATETWARAAREACFLRSE